MPQELSTNMASDNTTNAQNQDQDDLLVVVDTSKHVGVVPARSSVTTSIVLWAVRSGAFDAGNILVVKDTLSGVTCRLVGGREFKNVSPQQIWIEHKGKRSP
jgi:hypothetical protein